MARRTAYSYGHSGKPSVNAHKPRALINAKEAPVGTWVMQIRGRGAGRVGIVRMMVDKYEIRVQFGSDGPIADAKVTSFRLVTDDEKNSGSG